MRPILFKVLIKVGCGAASICENISKVNKLKIQHISNRPETTRQRANCWLNADTSVLASNIRRASRICARHTRIPTKSENTIDHVGAKTNMLLTLAEFKWAPRLLYDVTRIITIKAPFVIISHS